MQVRQSPVGQRLSDDQFDDVLAICGIIKRGIHKDGAFREKLSDFVHAFARTEQFFDLKAEEIIRDMFTEFYGETMNQMRERLVNREREIEPNIGEVALQYGQSVIGRVSEAPTMPFHRANTQTAVEMATEYGITQAGAKRMIREAFRSHNGRELYEAGKEAEEQFHKPVREEASRSRRRSFSRSRG
jgi:hypothetical protein